MSSGLGGPLLIIGVIAVAGIGIYIYCKKSGKCSLNAITQSLPIPGGGSTIAQGNAQFNAKIQDTQGTTGPQPSSLTKLAGGGTDPNCSGGKSGYIGPGGEIIACGKYALYGGITNSGLTIDPNRISMTENKFK